MILDVSPDGRARMRRQARYDVDAWCEREGIEGDCMTVEILGRHGINGFEARLSFAEKRRKRVFVKEYPPASAWWYMTEGEK